MPPFRWRALLLAFAVALGLMVFLRGAGNSVRDLFTAPGRTTITQGAIIERIRSVAKLVTTEAAVRDVVTYEQTRLGSTKRALVVVTGKAMVGVDLSHDAQVTVDAGAHRIHVILPHAKLLGIDITELRTYDEQRGLWNPFHPADRDTIHMLARAQLAHAARDLAVLDHAETSARQLLTALLGHDGYAVEVEFRPFLAPKAAE
ncbi:MAG: DUF4230 domain-containing protein [Gemmatimonadota bacterium]|nr:DUF4230 domain-containing protein [Gemmatimonadota bacterium]